jgi:hypothetical protein
LNQIAFLVLAHGDEAHLRRLTQRLKPNPIFVHWDLKSGSPPSIDGVEFITKRKAVYWAGFSMVEATIELIRAALLKYSNVETLALLSGSCYPAKNINAINESISKMELSSINCFRASESPHLKNLLAKRVWRDGILPRQISGNSLGRFSEKAIRKILNAALGLISKRKPEDLVLYHGSQWWVLRKEIAEYALRIFETRPDIVNFFRFTFAPDESFFHSVVHSSHLSEKCSPPIKNVERGVFLTANIHLIDRSLSRTFKEDDLEEIIQSRKLFFRKVDTKSSSSLLDKIDQAADGN